MTSSVGIWSFGLSLCAIGVALLVQNLTGLPAAWRLADFWGALPILLGAEILLSSYLAGRKTGAPTRFRLHGPSVVGLAIILLVALPLSASSGNLNFLWGWTAGSSDWRYHETATASPSLTTPVDASVTGLTFAPPPGGTWTITGADTGEVRVQADLTVKAQTLTRAQESASGAAVTTLLEGGRLIVIVEVPGYDPDRPGSLVSVLAGGTITIPRRFALSVDASTSDVTATDLAGDVELRTATGDITARRLGGKLTVDTATGGVVAEDIAGEATIYSSTGSVEATRVRGHLLIESTTGGARIAEPGAGLDVHLTTGSCSVTTSSLVAGDWRVESTTGSIDVSFPKNSNVRVAAQVGPGSVTGNLGLSVTSSPGHKVMEGTLGQGTYLVDLSASTGSVNLQGTEP